MNIILTVLLYFLSVLKMMHTVFKKKPGTNEIPLNWKLWSIVPGLTPATFKCHVINASSITWIWLDLSTLRKNYVDIDNLRQVELPGIPRTGRPRGIGAPMLQRGFRKSKSSRAFNSPVRHCPSAAASPFLKMVINGRSQKVYVPNVDLNSIPPCLAQLVVKGHKSGWIPQQSYDC